MDNVSAWFDDVRNLMVGMRNVCASYGNELRIFSPKLLVFSATILGRLIASPWDGTAVPKVTALE
jgi:hypothetical protein